MDRRLWAPLLLTIAFVGVLVTTARPSSADHGVFVRIAGEGSTWAADAIDESRIDLETRGIAVNYNRVGSTAGRRSFLSGVSDFAVSDMPFLFDPEDGSPPELPTPGTFVYLPITAGGTAFVYQLSIDGRRVTNLRLSGENLAKIFTRAITSWDDPAIQADNPGLALPARSITPVVRSEGAAMTQSLTEWMIDRHPQTWRNYCVMAGRPPGCGPTSFYPTVPGVDSYSGDFGVSAYVAQPSAEGSIGYVNYSTARAFQLPVVKLLNQAGYYVEPTPANVAVSLLATRIRDDPSDPTTYLTHDVSALYTDPDPRSYPLSSYSYLIVPTVVQGGFTEAKGHTLAEFAYDGLCRAQQRASTLGYAPLPVNLVAPSIDLLSRIPGAATTGLDLSNCANPTISAGGQDLLRASVPMPPNCDLRSERFQCSSGTGGLADVPTPTDEGPALRLSLRIDPSSGTATTPFRLVATGPPSCPETAAPIAASRWHTFVTPASVDPATLSFGVAGPAGPDTTVALRDLAGNTVADRPTDPVTGSLGVLPEFTLGALDPDAVAPGIYRVGLACVDGARVTALWSMSLTLSRGPGPGQLSFAVVEPTLVQDIQVRRPQGALVLTQRCGVFGSAAAYTDDVFGSLAALAATPGADPAGVDAPNPTGTAPLTDAVPADPNSGLGPADALFPQYPYPVDGNGDSTTTYPTNCGIDLGIGTLVTSGPRAGQYFRATGRIAQLTVVNTRDADSGWTLNGRMSPFASIADPTDTFSGNLLGWDPEVTWHSDANLDGYAMDVHAGAARQPEPSGSTTGLGAPSNSSNTMLAGSLAASSPGRSLGQAVIDARLRLLIPVTADAGTYRGTLTFTTV